MLAVKAIFIAGMLLAPVSVQAHGERVALAEWGGYAPATARCQRAVLVATLRCARSAWSVRRRCLASDLAGETCDRAATNARVVAIRRRALDLVDAACSERQLGEIGFLGQFDLQADVVAGCRDWDVLMRSAIFEPVASPNLACRITLDRSLTRATARVARGWQRVMRKIAARSFPAEKKFELLDRERSRQARATERAVEAVVAGCGEQSALTARTERIVELSLCPVMQVSVQDGVLCPEPVCGNGLIEPGELCDDGVAAGDDACRGGCD